MKKVSSTRNSRTSFPATFDALVLPLLTLLVILAGVGPTWALWMPWATEENKISKRIEDIWAAFMVKDVKTLEKYVTGNAAKPFIDQELEQIRVLKVKSYKCRVSSVRFDGPKREFAFVDLEKVATMEDGREVVNRVWLVLRKIDKEWKLLADAGKRRKGGRKPGSVAGKARNQASKGASAADSEPLPDGSHR
jgi:hypothetical protein